MKTVEEIISGFDTDKWDYKSPSPTGKTEKERRLGGWMQTQRNIGRDHVLEKRVKKLESVPNWYWFLGYEKKWQNNFIKAKQTIFKHYDTSLYRWVTEQKVKYRKGKLDVEKIKKLETVSGWSWSVESKWDKHLSNMREFAMKQNRYPLEDAEDIEEKKLGIWLKNQKRAKINPKGRKLTEERIKKLESLPNWEWGMPIESKWEKRFLETVSFEKEHGKIPVKDSKNKIESILGEWVSKQRQAKKGIGMGKMTPERIKKLESIPNWEWVKSYKKKEPKESVEA